MTFTAKYPGVCGACGEQFLVKDFIRRYVKGYAHDVCPEPIPEAQRDICPVCFTERAANGRCMCHDRA